MINKKELKHLYIIDNLSINDVAKKLRCSKSKIHYWLKKYGIKKDPKNISISRKLKTFYNNNSWSKGSIKYYSQKFRQSYALNSKKDLQYLKILEQDKNVTNTDYKLIQIPYLDRISGSFHLYVVDFSVQRNDRADEWIEMTLHDKMTPNDGRLYANRSAKASNIKFRGLSKSEFNELK